MNDNEMVELVDEITELLEERDITPGEWSAISQRVQTELDARSED